jgi:hypothetical protein
VLCPAAACRNLTFAGSVIGNLKMTQEMLDFCGKHGIHADVEVGVLTVSAVKQACSTHVSCSQQLLNRAHRRLLPQVLPAFFKRVPPLWVPLLPLPGVLLVW